MPLIFSRITIDIWIFVLKKIRSEKYETERRGGNSLKAQRGRMTIDIPSYMSEEHE